MTAFPAWAKKYTMSETLCDTLKKEPAAFPQVDLIDAKNLERIFERYKDVSGIYFWVMRYSVENADADALVPIYIGKTKSLAYRVKNYTSHFQPHAPNDFKLLVFKNFLSQIVPSAAVDLLFWRKPVDELTRSEKAKIDLYHPLLNRRLKASPHARANLECAFSEYYASAFGHLLHADD